MALSIGYLSFYCFDRLNKKEGKNLISASSNCLGFSSGKKEKQSILISIKHQRKDSQNKSKTISIIKWEEIKETIAIVLFLVRIAANLSERLRSNSYVSYCNFLESFSTKKQKFQTKNKALERMIMIVGIIKDSNTSSNWHITMMIDIECNRTFKVKIVLCYRRVSRSWTDRIDLFVVFDVVQRWNPTI